MNPRRARPLLALFAALALGGCAPEPRPPAGAALLSGNHPGAVSPPELKAADAVARGFARAYAASIYRAGPPPLPGTSAAVDSQLRAAAERVPPTRRDLHPRAGALRLEPVSPQRIDAALTILDGRSPPFSVGFRLERRRGRWLVTSISPPG